MISRSLTSVAFAAIGLLAALPASAADTVVMTCDAQSGYTYYAGGARHPGDGWTKDSVNAELLLVQKDNGTFDLISQGAPPYNFTYSDADHGCRSIGNEQFSGGNELVLTMLCPKAVEVFFFRWNADKSGELISTSIASSEISNRGGALHSVCRVSR